MFKAYKNLKYYKKEVILGPMFKIIEAVFELIVPLVMANIIDIGILNKDYSYILKMIIVLISLSIIGLLSTLVCQYYATKVSVGYATVLREELFKKINQLTFEDLDDANSYSLINIITNDVNALQLSVNMAIRLIIRAPFLVIGSTIMAIIINPLIGGIFLAIGVILAFVIYLIMHKSIPHFKKSQMQLDDITKITKENLKGVRVVRAFRKQDDEEKRFVNNNQNLYKSNIKSNAISNLINPLTYIIINIGIILIIYIGGFKVNNGILKQGQIIALVNYMMQILLALIVVAQLVVIFTKASASGMRVNQILEIKSNQRCSDNSVSENIDYISVHFKNVSFGYKDDSDTVKNLSFKFFKNKTYGIIGTTGSGKTTIANLIGGFYKARSGEILIDGCNINNFDRQNLIKKISIIPQKPVLFKGTIRENMQFRKEDAEDEEIIKALQIAQADFAINLGLDYMLEAFATNLSYGQTQRLCIARSLINIPEIIIFDDSSSALDFKTDLNLRRNIKKYLNNSTIIQISQRVQTIKNADQIIVLKDGIIEGIGTHEELLKTCSFYNEISSSQEVKYEDY